MAEYTKIKKSFSKNKKFLDCHLTYEFIIAIMNAESGRNSVRDL